MSVIGIIIPTWNNNEFLIPCLNSIVNPLGTEDMVHVYVVNNGDKENMEMVGDHPRVTILQQETNLGWEGGLKKGLEVSKENFVMFLNDDTYIPLCSLRWTNQLLAHFSNPQVGAVGPSTNVVMGAQQIFAPIAYNDDILKVKFLIGFCMLLRRSALDAVGGVDDTLPGGDDFDLSIRLRQAGYTLLVNRNVFVYHHGFKTGERLHGHASQGGWNSMEMTERTNFGLINKHGLRPWLDCMKEQIIKDKSLIDPSTGWKEDSEGDLVRQYIIGQGSEVADLGCGMRKTLPDCIGIDRIPKGETVPGVAPGWVSMADVMANAEGPIPVEDGRFKTVIARHILEHVVDSVKAIQEWGRILEHGGRLIIAVPNHAYRNTIPMNIEHVRAFTPESLRNQMESLGWKTVDILDPKNYVSLLGIFEKNGLH